MTDKQQQREALAHSLGIPEMWLREVFAIESGDNPAAKNSTTGAVGLIQWMPATLREYGLLPNQVQQWSYGQQLELVKKYLTRYKPKNLTDLYLSIFYPYAINRGPNYILGSEKSKAFARAIFDQNPGFRTAKNAKQGFYKKKDITNYVLNDARKRFGYTRLQYLIDKFL